MLVQFHMSIAGLFPLMLGNHQLTKRVLVKDRLVMRTFGSRPLREKARAGVGSRVFVVISLRLCAYGCAVAITSYVDPSVEPTELIGDTLRRCVPAPRGGRRGYNQKLRHLQEGIAQGLYSNRYSFVLPGGHAYAARIFHC